MHIDLLVKITVAYWVSLDIKMSNMQEKLWRTRWGEGLLQQEQDMLK